MNARVTSESQSFRLVERMEEARISHGKELRADLPKVRVLALAGVAEVPALFCNMGPIRVREILNRGDDRPLPAAVTLEGLQVPTSGTYDILNALVCSNGDLRLVVDGATSVVLALRAPLLLLQPVHVLVLARRERVWLHLEPPPRRDDAAF